MWPQTVAKLLKFGGRTVYDPWNNLILPVWKIRVHFSNDYAFIDKPFLPQE